jgi:hypothetical protein
LKLSLFSKAEEAGILAGGVEKAALDADLEKPCPRRAEERKPCSASDEASAK